MKQRIEAMAELGRVTDDMREQHKGFLEWDSVSSRRDHQTIFQVLYSYIAAVLSIISTKVMILNLSHLSKIFSHDVADSN